MDKNVEWRTIHFRKHVKKKIEEEITKLGISTAKSSVELEDEAYQKALSKDEYLKFIAQLIYNMRQKNKELIPTDQGTFTLLSDQSPFQIELSSCLKNDSKDGIKKYTPRSKFKKISKPKKSRKYKSNDSFICAACDSIFTSKLSIKKHIRITRHMIKEALPNSLMSMLPQKWNFTVINYFKTNNGYKIELCLPAIKSFELTQDWMVEFMKLNQCTYIWQRTNANIPKTQQEVVYCCPHIEKQSKSTCRSTISFTIDNKLSYATIIIDFDHDHALNHNDTPRHCTPSAEVIKILFKYFENSSNAVEAFRNFQIHVETQLETEHEYQEYISDKRKMPALSCVCNLYNAEFKNKPITPNHIEIESLKKFICEKNEEFSESCQFQELSNQNFVIFLVTPCMRRALRSRAASELVYTDNIGSVAQHGLRVYMLLTNIKNEAVPLAVMISSSETNKAIKTGFGLLSTSLDDQSFMGKRTLGPAIIMTDDSLAEMTSMKGLFPHSKIVLSTFHFLKSCYKWLTKIEHKICKQNREIIYAFIKNMVYAESETVLHGLFDNLAKIYKNHELVCTYISKLFEKKQTWALCYRRNFAAMESHRSTSKHTLRTLKEQIYDKIKLREPKRLVAYFLNEFSDFYSRRLIDCALNRSTNEKQPSEEQNYQFIRSKHCESIYTLQNHNTGVKYSINTDINVCTCYIGFTGALCEHQKILDAYLNQSDNQCTDDTETKLELYYIVSGCKDVPEEFFGLSQKTDDVTQKAFFDGVQIETIIDNSNPSNTENEFDGKFHMEVDLDEKNCSQIYPMIINNDIEDESIVKIEDSDVLSEGIRIESAPRFVYSIVIEENSNSEVVEIVQADEIHSSQMIDEVIDHNSESHQGSSKQERGEAMKREMILFHKNMDKFRTMIKENPDYYKHGLMHLNQQLAEIKSGYFDIFQALNTYKVEM